ncbi:MAG: glucans biosynthesis glucosyltransferase MdoH [Candidatus Omnitrophota bacterium]
MNRSVKENNISASDERDPGAAERRADLYLRLLELPEEQKAGLMEEFRARLRGARVPDDLKESAVYGIRELFALLEEKGLGAEGIFREYVGTPPGIRRSPIAYRGFDEREKIFVLSRIKNMISKNRLVPKWERVAFLRRSVLFLFVLGSSCFSAISIHAIFADQGMRSLEWGIVIIFTVLFTWISINFATVLMGFFRLLRKNDLLQVSRALDERPGDIAKDFVTAIILPVYNENMSMVFSSLRAMYRSAYSAGSLAHFHFFILSDSADPGKLVEEEQAWSELCRELDAAGRIFYRHRRERIGGKSGNIADFCRRWGSMYKYMIVLDADSLMSGRALISLVKIMEVRPDIGILQSIPKGIAQKSLIARIHQFVSHIYGPLYLAGLHYWQLGDAAFWGHNAIIRMKPFIKFCALPKLSGRPPFGGKILSHDIVEAALIRRMGYGVWLVYDLEESYEQFPSSLLVERERDRRWCQGNIQHLRLIFMNGISMGHRFLFLTGNMFYFASFFWFLLTILVTVNAIVNFMNGPVYFSAGKNLFPLWPEYHYSLSLALLTVTIIYLLAPKLLSILYIAVWGKKTRHFGKFSRLLLSIALESVISLLLAPLRMLDHTISILHTLLGQKIEWTVQRAGENVSFGVSARTYWPHTVFGAVWALTVLKVSDILFWWLSVVLFPLILSIPLSVITSRIDVGLFFRKWGIFIVPVELDPPKELVDMEATLRQGKICSVPENTRETGFIWAAARPRMNALHEHLLRLNRKLPENIQAYRKGLEQKAIESGPASLSPEEKNILLFDRERFKALHRRIWELPDKDLFEKWMIPAEVK